MKQDNCGYAEKTCKDSGFNLYGGWTSLPLGPKSKHTRQDFWSK